MVAINNGRGKMSSNKVKGIMCIISSAFCFALMNMFVRMARRFAVNTKSFFRNFIALIIAFIVLIRTDEKFKFNKKNLPELLLRSIFGTVGFFCNFYAIDHLVLSDASMLNKLSPFLRLYARILCLKKGKAVPGFEAVIVAFIGALFIIKPQSISGKLFKLYWNSRGGFGAECGVHNGRKLSQKGRKGPFIVFFFSAFFVCCDIAVFDS